MTTDREDAEQRDDEKPWLPPGTPAVDAEDTDGPGAEDEDLEPEEDEELDEEVRESYGTELAAPWSEVPLAQARGWIRKHGAEISLVFPAPYAEDRPALVKDLLSTQDFFTKHRIADALAAEFQFSDYDFPVEMEAVERERKQYPDLGVGDVMAARVASLMRPSDDEPEMRRDDVSAPERARFRKQQRETEAARGPRTLVWNRGDGRQEVIHEFPGLFTPPSPAELAGRDLEAFYRSRRLELQAQRQAEAASPPVPPMATDSADEGIGHIADLEHSAELLAEARAQAAPVSEEKAEPLPRGPQLTREEVHYGFSDVTHQVSLGLPIRACGTCRFFRPPGTPSEPGACEIVVGPIRGVDVCDRFSRKPAR